MDKLTAKTIDAVLPQTQCGLCGYGGCLPYAKAIVATQAPINLCPPGGVPVLQALSTLTGIDATPYVADMAHAAKPAQLAVIDEALCIGCTKCIAVCPVDAILGAPKQMHGILTDACTGCGLCLPPCPMDCIALVEVTPPTQAKRNDWRLRHQQHLARTTPPAQVSEPIITPQDSALDYIAAAVTRRKGLSK